MHFNRICPQYSIKTVVTISINLYVAKSNGHFSFFLHDCSAVLDANDDFITYETFFFLGFFGHSSGFPSFSKFLS